MKSRRCAALVFTCVTVFGCAGEDHEGSGRGRAGGTGVATAGRSGAEGYPGTGGATVTGRAGAAANATGGETGTGAPTAVTDPADAGPPPNADVGVLALPDVVAVDEGHFSTSPVCAGCHSNSPGATAMRDDQDRAIGFVDLWQSTMMANSARDPFWRAVVSAEVAATPSRRAEIEAKCVRCHTPMAAADARLHGGEAIDMTVIGNGSNRGQLALDGVSCTLCHQIEPDGLGTPNSYTGGFTTVGSRVIYGPHEAPFAMPMVFRTGFTPTYSKHVRESALCGSCHTLETHAFTPDGTLTGDVLPEQAPYLEWRNSAFSTEGPSPGAEAQSCQGCHMPAVDEDGLAISTRLARNPGGFDFPPLAPRSPFARHIFVGGNTLMPAIIRDNADVLRPQAPAAAFDATIALAADQLAHRTATLSIAAPRRSGDNLELDIALANLAGHDFPTAYPARRAWLRVRVTDASGAVVFVSGDFDSTGTLVDAAGRVLASENASGPIQPHRDRIDMGDQVYVLESVMAAADGTATYRLLRGARYLKENRLLPRGWSAQHSDAAATAPVGTDGDTDFAAGGDTVTYAFAAPAAAGPYTVRAELLYQPISARYAAELFHYRTPQVAAFQLMYQRADRRPAPVASAERGAD